MRPFPSQHHETLQVKHHHFKFLANCTDVPKCSPNGDFILL